VPVHGEYRQLSQHARVARRVFAGRNPHPEILLAENGDVIQFDRAGAHISDRVPVGRVLIDGTGTGEVGDEVLRDRRHVSQDGLLVPVVAINKQTGSLEGIPEVVARGLVTDAQTDGLLRDGARLVAEVIEGASVEERTDQGLIKERLRAELRRFFRKRTGRRPLVLPIVMEI
jgi:ribonuclease J